MPWSVEALHAWVRALVPGRPAKSGEADVGTDPFDPRLAFGAGPRAAAAGWQAVTAAEARALHERPDGFLDLLPWIDYLPDEGTVLLEDGHSRGVLLELRPLSAEAMPPAWFADLHGRVEAALINAVPESDPPWLLQFYLQDDPHASRRVPERLRAYAGEMSPDGEVGPITETYCALLDRHLSQMCRPQGLFVDELVTGMRWRGKERLLRACLYRRTPEDRGSTEIVEVAARFAAALDAIGIRTRRCDGHDLYDWLMPWFTPRPSWAGGDPHRVLTEFARPDFEPAPGGRPRRPFSLPYGRDLAQWLVGNYPYSHFPTRTWWFDALPHVAISVDRLDHEPHPGLLSAEHRQGEYQYAVFDRMPEGTVLAITIEVRAQDDVKLHLQRLLAGSRAGSPEAERTHEDALAAQRLLTQNHALLPTALTCYVRGDDLEQVQTRRMQAEALLAAHGLRPITTEADLLGLDTYVRHLPMAYVPAHDRRARRSRMQFSYDVAALLPVYGRARGTGNGAPMYNRGGETLQFDPLNKADRAKNGHLLLLGPTGSGKSAQVLYLVLSALALHRPRVTLIEAGNSFGLFVAWLQRAGFRTHSVRIQPSSPVAICPFTQAQLLLATKGRLTPMPEEEPPESEEDAGDDDENRDLLGEMELAARIMITGGEEKEDARMTRADRFRLRAAILAAAARSREEGRSYTLTRDIVAALRDAATAAHLTDAQRQRTNEMADALALFTQGVEGEFFDRPGEAWPDVDVTHIDMGLYAREGHGDKLVVTMVGLFNRINDIAERNQHTARQGLVVVDEAHLLTTNPLLAPYLAKVSKMWRKLGFWLWLATQNLADFPDTAKKLLNMIEWWLLLVMPKEEVGELRRFRSLSAEQESLLLSARKAPGQYIEGVVFADRIEALFRSVLPPLVLALAQTDKHEKAERARLMREHGVDELAAVELVAAAIEQARDSA